MKEADAWRHAWHLALFDIEAMKSDLMVSKAIWDYNASFIDVQASKKRESFIARKAAMEDFFLKSDLTVDA